MYDHNIAFTLRIPDESGGRILITVWDDRFPRLDVEVRHKGRVVFPRGAIWCGMPRCGPQASDGTQARELVCDLVAMRPGDTDDDYFEDYSADQITWVERYSDEIRMVAQDRYLGRAE